MMSDEEEYSDIQYIKLRLEKNGESGHLYLIRTVEENIEDETTATSYEVRVDPDLSESVTREDIFFYMSELIFNMMNVAQDTVDEMKAADEIEDLFDDD